MNKTTTNTALAYCRDWTARTGNECGIVVVDGKQELIIPGEKTQVAFPAGPMNEWLQSCREMTIVHSHPNNSAFSPQDLGMAAQGGEKVSGALITPDGSRFTFDRSTMGNPAAFDRHIMPVFVKALLSLSLRYARQDLPDENRALTTAATLLACRQAAHRGFLFGYTEELGPTIAAEDEYLRRLGWDENGYLQGPGLVPVRDSNPWLGGR